MSRARIMGRIGAALDPAGTRAARRASAGDRLARPVAHVRPRWATEEAAEHVARFKEMQRALGVDMIEVAAADEIPAAIAAYLYGRGLPPRLRMGSDPPLAALPWPRAASLVVDTGPARDGDTAGLSRAVAGVAETGTLVLASGPGSPVTLGFLPDTHIVLLGMETIVGSYEEGCALALAANGGVMPRTLNLVTGASRTGDIGGKIVMGAHGPRRLAVILVAWR
jgi:L-lactate dehydrogenase complex protein LldG